VVSADLLASSIRIDYGNPTTRSIINTTAGSTEILNGTPKRKPSHVGLFAQLDLLSVFGLVHLQTGNVTWSDLGATTVAGRSASSQRADTGQTKEQFQRTLRDQADIRFDVETGLVASTTRVHYAENSLDFSMPVTFVFSDYRTVNGVVFPYRIEQYLNTSLIEAITVTQIEFNPPFSTSIFAR
jgi:hypothetical protein